MNENKRAFAFPVAGKAKSNPKVWRRLIFLCTVLFTLALLVFQIFLQKSIFSLKVGDVASQEILAPRTVTYASDILTEQARKDAEDMVGKVYLPADPTISRNQVQQLRYAFQFINTIREDDYASTLQQIDDFKHILFFRLDDATINQVLDLSDEDWSTIQTESQRVLEVVMQNSIRDTQVTSEIGNIPTMINYYISSQNAAIINTITQKFVTPNSLFSQSLTDQSKMDARDAVQPRERTFVANQTIVSRGQIISELIYEALDEMGLVYSKDNTQRLITALLVVLGLAMFAFVFFSLEPSVKPIATRELLLIAVSYLIFLVTARILIPNRTVLPYIFPIQALGLIAASLCGNAIGFFISIVISVIVPYDFSQAIGYTVFYLITSISAILLLRKGRQISYFLVAGAGAGLIGIPLILAYQLVNGSLDNTGILTLSAASLLSNMISAAITLFAQYLFSRFFGLTSSIQLMELIRPDSPLLQFILNAAPGTYQHSLMVANLSEQAAKKVGADPLLVRAGAMYHDVGKAINPSFFVENQVSGNLNLHQDISPRESAASIIQHVPDGVNLIRKYKLPNVLIDFVEQHHGTNVTRFQLNQALNGDDDDEVNIEDFTYPGPSPRSKETALVMLADTCEARARAEKPKNDAEIDELVKSVFDYYSTNGQLDHAPLTLKDMTKIRGSFIRVLRNTYHPRVKYPEAKNKKGSNPKDSNQPRSSKLPTEENPKKQEQ